MSCFQEDAYSLNSRKFLPTGETTSTRHSMNCFQEDAYPLNSTKYLRLCIYESLCSEEEKAAICICLCLWWLSFSRLQTLLMAPRWKYDAFLSFRGEDIRNSFVSHLHNAMRRKGIITFKDDRELERGKPISDGTDEAINNSRFFVVIFSKNYASSTWCLSELLTILNCTKEGTQTVLPIFYRVDPSEVRKQTGDFAKAFADHERALNDNPQRVDEWRAALTQVANISGLNLCDKDETEFIEAIVEEILSKLRRSSNRFSSLAKDFVGMDRRLGKINSYLDVGRMDDVRFVGIWGMGGIGKTTIARVVYEKLSRQFECSSFLHGIREANNNHGLPRLQEQLLHQALMDRSLRVWDVYNGMDEIRNRLCSRRVLIVLDDVVELEELKSLAGSRDWFGSGSRIIITTRDEHPLTCHGVDEIYNVETLDDDEAIQLFRPKAFDLENTFPTEEYLELSEDVVKYANGLPLALDILGSYLCGRSVNEWRSALQRLKEIPPRKILEKLQISFDGLDAVDQKIFLDLACFFNEESYKFVRRILKGCGLHPDIGINVLVNKSLIKISGDLIYVHDLLQEMARQIVRKECYEEPGKRSRLWLHSDINHVLMNDTGSEKVEGIVLKSSVANKISFSGKSFLKLTKMRLLRLRRVQLSYDLKYFPSELRYLELDQYPFKYLPPTLQLYRLVELRMSSSNIEKFLLKTKPLEMLKVLDLSDSQNLVRIGGFEKAPNLKRLILEGCIRLIEVNESIGVLKRLLELNLKGCKSLVELPDSTCDLKSLKTLNVDCCAKLRKLPKRFGDVPSLEELSVSGIIKSQSVSKKPWDFLFGHWRAKNINPVALMLPSFSALRKLTEINLSACNLSEGVIPNDLSGFPSLRSLNLSGNHFVSIPTSIIQLSKLEKVSLINCKQLQSLPDLPRSLIWLRVDGCTSLSSFPNPIEKWTLAPWMFSFVNCKLNGIQGALSWLRSYFNFLLKCKELGICYMLFDFTMFLPGNGIPDSFDHQEIGSSLEFQLPENWCDEMWMGFLVCATFGMDESVQTGAGNTIRCNLLAGPSPSLDQLMFRDAVSSEMYEGIRIKRDQLWLIFIPRDHSKDMNWWNGLRHLHASFITFGLKIMKCGLRLVYERDVEDLTRCRRPFKNLSLPSHHGCCSDDMASFDDNTCDNGVQSSEGGPSAGEMHPQNKLRMPSDYSMEMWMEMRTVVESGKHPIIHEF